MREEAGLSLIEVIISVALLSIIVVGSLGALSTQSKALFIRDERETAKNLAQSQMEFVKEIAYGDTYDPAPISDDYSGYSVAITTAAVSGRDENLQKIRVIVSHQGKPIIMTDNATLVGYKVN
jgi:prepilin-type N-terminal cleavage/methylation domain-containing protein